MNDNEKQIDLRIRRTHKLLWDSLFELMTQSKQKYIVRSQLTKYVTARWYTEQPFINTLKIKMLY